MTNTITSSTKSICLAVLFAAIGLIMSIPAIASAATYAYVTQTGEVRTVAADTVAGALLSAPDIDENSGVLLFDAYVGNVLIGNMVPGM